MPEDILFEHFDLLAETPGGVQKLRELILQLAVQGRLVPQDPNDTPASELLKEIEAEKQKLVREGKLKKPKALPEIKPEEVPFELPEGWEWVRLGNISEVNGGFAFKSSHYTNDGVRVVRISDFDEKGFKDDSIVRYKFSENLSSFKIEEGNILMAMTGGTVGKSLLVEILPETMLVNQRVAIIKILGRVIPEYIYSLIRTDLVQKIIQAAKNSTNDNISMRDITRFKVSLPPLSEQHRIVAKVDQLMALCDELEAKKEKQKATHARLNKSALQTLRESKTNDDLSANWTRVKNNFRQLFTTPESIQELRSTILQLAVQGKLVPQNPQDEPASSLLERIREEKNRLIKEGKIKKQKPLPEIKPEEVPFELPKGWEWGKLINVGYWAIGSGFPLSYQGKDKGDYLFCKVGDMNSPENERYIRKTKNYISKGILKKIKAKLHPPGTIIFPKIGGAIATNKRRILAKDSAIDNNCLGITPFNSVNNDWLFIQLLALDFTQYQSGTSLPALSQGVLANIIIGVPPLREQHRIVAKVDQFMALCDQLESNLSQSQTEGEKLMAAVVEETSGNRQEVDAKLRNPANQSSDEVASNTNQRISDTASAKPQPVNTAHPSPDPSTNRSSNPDSDKSKSNNSAAAILAFMQPGEQYTRSDILDALGLNVSAWNTGIRELKEQGYVVQTGEKRGAKYRLSNP